MIPVKFPQANKTYTAPAGMTAEQCGDLPVYQGVDGSGRPVIVSCFELS